MEIDYITLHTLELNKEKIQKLFPLEKFNNREPFLIEPTIKRVQPTLAGIYLTYYDKSHKSFKVGLFEIYYHPYYYIPKNGSIPTSSVIEIIHKRRETLPDFILDEDFQEHLYILKINGFECICYMDSETKKIIDEKLPKI